jgi:crotonobetainyl-CoA:carnitine CoA-transferase CaiB-like acyl-CoA transferase
LSVPGQPGSTDIAALNGVRILDFSRVLAGPFATMLLADLGAEVVKIERPGVGEDTRAWGPPYDARGESTYFDSVNRNKRSVVLDLGLEADLAVARGLAAEADVLVENFRPGLLEARGLGYDDLQAANAGLVYCSISGFGSGLGAELPGYDLLAQALGGLMSLTGTGDGEPQKVGVALVDVITGLFASVGILAALRHRDQTGEGQRLELNLLSCLLAAMVNQSSGFTAAGFTPSRMGNSHPSIAPYQLLHARDGDLVVAVGTDRQFGALCQLLDIPELAVDERFATNSVRVANRVALVEALERELIRESAAHWVDVLTDARVPAGQVNDVAEAFGLAERLGLRPVTELLDDRGVAIRLPRNPIELSRTPPTYRTAPPSLPSAVPSSGTAGWEI